MFVDRRASFVYYSIKPLNLKKVCLHFHISALVQIFQACHDGYLLNVLYKISKCIVLLIAQDYLVHFKCKFKVLYCTSQFLTSELSGYQGLGQKCISLSYTLCIYYYRVNSLIPCACERISTANKMWS